MKRFVIGDIHGGHKALVQCLERARFDPAHDLLISLGDICDGWPEVKQSIDELLKIKNLKVILGNHAMLNIDTYEYWQSDLVPNLYPDIPGRQAGR